ncbi:hypothetical protein DDV21_008630 [Streptococcus chenjunshii]|uniref:Role in replication n=1 Tax=Streptococcus chenjunshii TaxID=2173853 RepID=A0A372KP67_9STRE|nr:hypothetical protein [Streptococcus chenjunshii]AXQ79142.1 hypothetical protein DDV21_008630 [Streptococcus chenjunshii]RFU50976.1 hypothetical protein DDV22_05775 [Streptococcus chenjunshii]RFU53368.1 hypothetical protein DDV23_04915 [Streptococcus chenjunshii]
MKAIYKNKEAEVWRIAKDDLNQPSWVSEAFAKNYLYWLDNHLRILIPALYPNWSKDSRNFGYGMYAVGYIGDVIDLTNGKVVSKAKFEKDYRLI